MPARRRDRHGRGLRGVLLPPDQRGRLAAPSRAQRFDRLVADSVQRLERLRPDLAEHLREVELVVEQVPSAGPDDAAVPLGRLAPAGAAGPARVVVHRGPVESRAAPGPLRALLVHHVVVEQVARLLGLAPESLDPDHLGDY